jgi:hypothetical protein
MTIGRNWTCAILCVLLLAAAALAQFGGRRGGRGRQRVPEFDRGNVPEWQLEPELASDCFTFVRIKYRTDGPEHSSRAWWTDYPDADVNLSFRLHQLTSMRVDPNGKVIEVLDESLLDYPFAFMSGVPGITLDDDEAAALRRYVEHGGFIMVDDFWGEANFDHFYHEVVKRVFPTREPEELPLEHEIFNIVYKLTQKPQIPNVNQGVASRETGITWETYDGQTPHYRGVSDDRGRLMMLICHNTDLGDGWEEEGTDPYYFSTFSEPKAYPLGINIVFYAMTH